MLEPEGYTLGKQLVSGSHTELFTATRDSDGAAVVLKRYKDDQLDDGRSRAAREHALLRASEGRGSIRALDLLTDFGSPILVLEHVRGVALDEWLAAGLPLELDVVQVARQIAACLARVHAERLIHCDINPTNVLVDVEADHTAYLIDFGAARTLGTASQNRLAPSSGMVRGGVSLTYIAPEQSGRMGRGIDSRSDLYSFGATLYFALTGRPPFDTRDPLALIHAHIARLPDDPRELRPGLSPTLAKMVLKLLEKEPELRYQTADALAQDLDICYAELREHGSIVPFELGRSDLSSDPVFPANLFGREQELATLRAAFDRAAAGSTELVLLQGPAGIGKSALIDTIRRNVTERGGYLCSGKLEAYRGEAPYAAFIAAFDSFVHQMLCEDEARVESWRTRLREALGALAGVVTALVPDLDVVLEGAAAPPPLGPREARTRLAYALQRFLEACTAPEHPLVLVLENFDRADRASAWLLEELLSKHRAGYLLVIVTHHEAVPSIMEPAERLRAQQVSITPVELQPLVTEQVAALLAQVFDRMPEDVMSLAQIVAMKTGGNPLWIRELVLKLHADRIVQLRPHEGWSWDEEAVRTSEIPEGAVGLMIGKLGRLDPELRDLVARIACIAAEFDVTMLRDRLGDDGQRLEAQLFQLADLAVILPSRLGFRFAHGRLTEAAQGMFTSAEHAVIHRDVARRMLSQPSFDGAPAYTLEIADHFRLGHSALTEDDRAAALRMYVRAGEQLLGSGASAAAQDFFVLAHQLFRETDFDSNFALGFSLFLSSAEAANQAQDVPRALELLTRLEQLPLAPMQLAQVLGKQIRATLREDPERALELSLAGLRRLGRPFPRDVSPLRVRLQIRYTDWCLRGPLDERKFKPLDPTDLSWLPGIFLMSEAGVALLRTRGNLVALSVMRGLTTFVRRGTPRSPALTLAAYAALRVEFLGHCHGIERLVQAAETWSKKSFDPLNVRAEASLCCFALSWVIPRRELIPRFAKVSEQLLESGELEYSARCAELRIGCMLLTGELLPAVSDAMKGLGPWHGWRELDPVIELYPLLVRLLSAAEGEPDWTHIAETLNSRRMREPSRRIASIVVLCLLGRFDLAEPLTLQMTHAELFRSPMPFPDFKLFEGLCAAAMARVSTGRQRRVRRKRLRAALRTMEHLRPNHPDWAHMILALRAEAAALASKTTTAAQLYGESATIAAVHGFRHHAAFAHERRATLLRQLRRFDEAQTATQQAIALYRDWGAYAKVRQLESGTE